MMTLLHSDKRDGRSIPGLQLITCLPNSRNLRGGNLMEEAFTASVTVEKDARGCNLVVLVVENLEQLLYHLCERKDGLTAWRK